jgi:hypothetical protein
MILSRSFLISLPPAPQVGLTLTPMRLRMNDIHRRLMTFTNPSKITENIFLFGLDKNKAWWSYPRKMRLYMKTENNNQRLFWCWWWFIDLPTG